MTTELQRLVDGLAWRLRRNVAIDDPRVRLQAYSSHEGVPIDPIRERSILSRDVPPHVVDWINDMGASTATAPFRLPLAPELGITVSRLCVPIRTRGALLGFLWILDDDQPLSDDELRVVTEAVETIALVLQRDRLASELTHVRARELFRDLISPDDAKSREHAASELIDSELFVDGETALVAVVTLHPADRSMTEEERTVLASWLERASTHVSQRRQLSLVRRDHGVLLLSDRDPAVSGGGSVALAEELVDGLRRELADSDPFVGLGDPVAPLTAVHSSYQQARRAATVARIVSSLGRVAPFARLGVYGLLAHIPPDALTVDVLPSGLVRLLDAGSRGELLATLEAYLDRGCDARAAAKDLVIHRTTMYYRLERIAEVTGVDLARGDDRLAMHLGLKVARLAGLIP